MIIRVGSNVGTRLDLGCHIHIGCYPRYIDRKDHRKVVLDLDLIAEPIGPIRKTRMARVTEGRLTQFSVSMGR